MAREEVTNMNMQIDTTNQRDLEEAREIIGFLLSRQGEQEEGLTDDPSGVDELDTPVRLAEVWSELGDNTQRLLREAAQNFAAEEEFTLEELGTRMGLPVESVKAIHRNLSRGLRTRGINWNDVLRTRWSGQRQHYRLPAEVRDTILGL